MEMKHADLDPATRSGRTHVRTGIVVAAVQVIGLVLAIVQEMFAADLFGARREMDGYLAAWILPMTLGNVVGGAIQNSLIPHFAKARSERGADGAWALAGEAVGATLLVFGALAATGLVASPLVLGFTTTGASGDAVAIARSLYPLGFVYGALGVTTGILTGLSAATGRFVWPSLLANLTSGLPILFLWLGGKSLGVTALAMGLVAGTLLQAGILYGMLHAIGFRVRLPRAGAWGRLKAVASDGVAVALSTVPLGLLPVLERHFASLAGEGAASRLFYTSKFTSTGNQFLGAAMSVMGVPLLSAYVARYEAARFRQAFSLLLRISCYLAAGGIVGLVVCAQPLVQVLFERGRFTRGDTLAVATLLRWYSFALLYAIVFPVFNAAILSRRRAWLLPAVNLTGLAAYLGLVFFGGRLIPNPVLALAVAWGLSYNVILVAVALDLVIERITDAASVLSALARTALFVPAAGLPLWLVRRLVELDGMAPVAAVGVLSFAGLVASTLAVAAIDREVFLRVANALFGNRFARLEPRAGERASA